MWESVSQFPHAGRKRVAHSKLPVFTMHDVHWQTTECRFDERGVSTSDCYDGQAGFQCNACHTTYHGLTRNVCQLLDAAKAAPFAACKQHDNR
jgi:hypothetical protein